MEGPGTHPSAGRWPRPPALPATQELPALALTPVDARIRPWLVRLGRERLRLHPSSQPDGGVVITLLADRVQPSAALVANACAEAIGLYGPSLARIVTPAVAGPEARPYLDAKFRVADQLVLLTHDIAPPARWMRRWSRAAVPPAGLTSVSGNRLSDSSIVEIDARSFGADRSLDLAGLEVARQSTPNTRTQVLLQDDSAIGYAITGRDGRRGYLQRLGVVPNAWGRGVGSWLVQDALSWCARHGVVRVVVNTQQDNDRALALYVRHGFQTTQLALQVLEFVPNHHA